MGSANLDDKIGNLKLIDSDFNAFKFRQIFDPELYALKLLER